MNNNTEVWAYYHPSEYSDDRTGLHQQTSEGRGKEIGDLKAPRRKRLELKPRTAKVEVDSSDTYQPSKKGSNPFGSAKPREEVLASKGIDAKLVDDRIQKKATVVHFSKEQESQLEAVRSALTESEAMWREANENELPEEKYRVMTEQKRKELSDLMAKFNEDNASKHSRQRSGTTATGNYGREGKGFHLGTGARPRFERPSDRRKRLEQEKHRQNPRSERDSKSGNTGDSYAAIEDRGGMRSEHYRFNI